MAARRGDGHRLIRWLWTGQGTAARLARGALVPVSGLWQATAAIRNAGYRSGVLPSWPLGRPAVAVGNLTVGGSGKTPLARWIAQTYVAAGEIPGILLRGYGRDEVLLHQRGVPEAVVVANPDRRAGALLAAERGATVLVLDDAYQRRDVRRDLNVLVVSAEALHASRWCLPAGPWREPLAGAERADFVIVTRKRAGSEAALAAVTTLGRWTKAPIARVHLAVRGYHGMLSGRPTSAAALEGARVVAASAIADPEAFIAQTKATGAQVQAATWPDHHEFDDTDVAWLARARRKADQLVITEKDAVKLADRWPASVPEPLVAVLAVEWEAGEAELRERLGGLVSRLRSM